MADLLGQLPVRYLLLVLSSTYYLFRTKEVVVVRLICLLSQIWYMSRLLIVCRDPL